ncbi:MAG TPA: hypothetical protein VGM57_14955 [Pseudolabrys sp.]|jgi:uncharacterized membrane protein (GlpM family)
MSAFWLMLLLKIAMTAGIVVAASLIVERSGPFVGSMVASLPTAGGAAMIILAMDHPPDFIAQSAVGSIVSNPLVAVFTLTYAALAHRRSLLVSLGVAYVVWFCCAGLSRLVDWTLPMALLLCVVAFPLAIFVGSRFHAESAARTKVAFTARDLIWRAAVVTLSVLLVTAASSMIGSYFSGIFAFFPVAMGSYFVILHPRIGGPATASIAAHVQAPMIGLALGLIAVALMAEPAGVWWAYATGLTISIAWNIGLWMWRLRRKLA